MELSRSFTCMTHVSLRPRTYCWSLPSRCHRNKHARATFCARKSPGASAHRRCATCDAQFQANVKYGEPGSESFQSPF